MTLTQSILQGAFRFALVSLVAYAIWAFGGKMSTLILYSSITLAFVLLSGLLLHPLIDGAGRLARFYAIFVPGFLLYAALWCLGWFGIRGPAGEVFGSAAGLAGLTFVMTRSFKAKGVFLPAFAVLFLFHSLGYTLGGLCYYATYGKNLLAPLLEGHTTAGRLLWGLFYGLGFGAGLGYAFSRCQHPPS